MNPNSINLQPYVESISTLKRIQEKIFVEKINILYKNSFVSTIANLIASSVIFFGLNYTITIPYIGIWYVATLLITFFRLGIIPIYKHWSHLSNLCLTLFMIGTAISGISWGLVGSILMPLNDPTAQMIILSLVCGVSANGIQSLQANIKVSILFSVLTVLPICIWLFMQQGFEHVVLGISMTVYLLFVIISSFRAHHLLTQALKFQYENLILVEDLSKSNKVLKHKNRLLKLHENDMNIINNMNQTLQICQSSVEAYSAIKMAAQKIFNTLNGGLTVTDVANNQTLATSWGEDQILESTFLSNNCWAYRSGNEYVIHDPENETMCLHYTKAPDGIYICIPLIAHNNIVGILNFNIPKSLTITNYMKQMMIAFSDAIKLSLANIKLHEKLQQEATHDPLTNLFNRRYLNETLPRELQRVIREKTTLCVAMIDLDYFKDLNDTFGHEAGDEVLKFIGTYLNNTFRGSDIACRFGGEEFVLVLANTDIPKVLPRLEHIASELKRVRLHYKDEALPHITISIGVAQAPQHGLTLNDIIRVADEALYVAKGSGRDKIVIANSSSQ
jgi:diguanylate cyclase (GGDEF)-like protein